MATISEASALLSPSDLLDQLGLSMDEKSEFKQALLETKEDVRILLSGTAGTGKSRLVNALCGEIVAKEGGSVDPETAETTKYKAKSYREYTITVWDTPGFLDGTDKESKYFREMKAQCHGKVDMLLYCVDMSAPRAADAVRALTHGVPKLSEALGVDVWKHAMIVLTYANVVVDRIQRNYAAREDQVIQFVQKVASWKKVLSKALQDARVPRDVVENIPFEPAGDYRQPMLPDRIHWLGYLWVVFFNHIRDEAKLTLLLNNHNRLQSREYLEPVASQSLVIEQEWLSKLAVRQPFRYIIMKILRKRAQKELSKP